MSGMLIADRLADFALESWSQVPASVADNAKLRIIDSVGIAVSATAEPFARPTLDLAREWYTSGDCTAIGMGHGLSAPAAGLVNGILVHGQDFDDTHTEGLVHASACIVPAALALGEHHDLSGRDVLALASIGYELIVRLGLGASPGGQIHARGFHTTAIAGALAVAVMAAVATGAGHSVTRNAMALATSVASGLTESARDGTFAKAVQPGWAVQGGMWAARAAAAEMTGPIEALEGRFGFYEAFAGLENAHLDRLTDSLGEKWRFVEGDFKLYPFCHHLQPHIDSGLSIRAEAQLNELEQVVEIQASVCEQVAERVCVPLEERLCPTSPYSAKFSLHYSIAMALAGSAFEPEDFVTAIDDESLQRVAALVHYREIVNRDFPQYLPGSVKVTLRDGRVYERFFRSAPGIYGRAVKPEEIADKFRQNVARVLGPEKSERALARIDAIADGQARGLLRDLLPDEVVAERKA